tara:strand:+ start:426 stop:806 length:381 start_codon:yes stop_codon:yes gene_type:complete
MAEPIAPGAPKPLPTPVFAEILASLNKWDQCPPVIADGPGLPDLTLEPHLDAARTWCDCPACRKIRANFPLPKLLGLKITSRWLVCHTVSWEGVTPETEALAAESKIRIPTELAEQKPMGVPAPFL